MRRMGREGFAPLLAVLVILAAIGVAWMIWTLYATSPWLLAGVLLLLGLVGLRWAGWTNMWVVLGMGTSAFILIVYGLATSGVIH